MLSEIVYMSCNTMYLTTRFILAMAFHLDVSLLIQIKLISLPQEEYCEHANHMQMIIEQGGRQTSTVTVCIRDKHTNERMKHQNKINYL